MQTWAGFLVCTALIVYSGTGLSKYGDFETLERICRQRFAAGKIRSSPF